VTTWLFIWHPKYLDWDNAGETSVDVLINRIAAGEPAVMEWSSGAARRVMKGDRIFIMRLGYEPKGIVAGGCAQSDVYMAPCPGKSEFGGFVEIRFDKVVRTENLLPLGVLRMISPFVNWTPVRSGMRLPPDVAAALEDAWNK